MDSARGFIVRGYPWLLYGLLAAWAALLAYNTKALAAEFRGLLSRKSAWAIGLFFAAALAVRLWGSPRAHQVYFDEFEHVNIAANMARLGSFAESRVGGFPDFDVLEAPTWPGGFHAMLSLAFKLFGTGESTAFAFNAVLAALTVPLLFLLSLLLFRDGTSAALSAFLWAALPLHLQYSGATDLTIASCFWIAATLLAVALWRRRGGLGLGLLFLASLAYAAHTRYENLLLVPACAFLLIGETKIWPLKARSASWAVLLALLWPLGALVSANRDAGLPGFDGSWASALASLAAHLPGNLAYLALSPGLALIAAPALYALWTLRREGRVETRLLAAVAALYLVGTSCFFRGDFGFGSENRYALPVLLPLILLAGAGLKRILDRFPARLELAGLFAAAFLALCWPAYGKINSERYEKEYRLIRAAAPLLPRDGYVISWSAPAILSGAGTPSMSAADLDEAELSRRGEPSLFKDYWWYERGARSQELEERLLRSYSEEPFLVEKIDGKPYGFWRLSPR